MAFKGAGFRVTCADTTPPLAIARKIMRKIARGREALDTILVLNLE
jgi:hypothetical protein